jgi:hypothetical protein
VDCVMIIAVDGSCRDCPTFAREIMPEVAN